MKTNLLKIVALMLLLNAGTALAQIQFAPYINIVTGSWPEVVAIDDVNNDGLKDVVMGTNWYNSPNDYKILVFLQNANGTLNAPFTYPYGNAGSITSVDIADLNNDNLNDVAIGYGSKIGVFFQNNSGTLNSVTEMDANANVSIKSLKTKDLNNDGLADITIGTSGSLIKVYYQSGTGFNGVSYTKPALDFSEVEVGDINNDNRPDLVFTSRYASNVYVYYQNTDGSFADYASYFANNSVGGIAAGDTNDDGLNDVVATAAYNSPASKISVLRQDAVTHLLNNPTDAAAYDIPEPVEIADLNNDGLNEIVMVHGGWLKLSVFEQNAVLFNPYTLYNIPYASHYDTQGMDVGDINNDGRKDIAIADYNNGLVILYNISTLDTQENTAAANHYVIYPNPATDKLHIHTESTEAAVFEITDTNGKVLIWGNNNQFESIDISQFQSGFYLLTIKTDTSRQTYKIIKR